MLIDTLRAPLRVRLGLVIIEAHFRIQKAQLSLGSVPTLSPESSKEEPLKETVEEPF